jgi:hypothetical protein
MDEIINNVTSACSKRYEIEKQIKIVYYIDDIVIISGNKDDIT